jgi:hypothetical protein
MATDTTKRKFPSDNVGQSEHYKRQELGTPRSRWGELLRTCGVTAARLLPENQWDKSRTALYHMRLILESLARRSADVTEFTADTTCQAAATALAHALRHSIICSQPSIVEYALKLLCFVSERHELDSAAPEHRLRHQMLTTFFKHGGAQEVIRTIRSPILSLCHYALRFVHDILDDAALKDYLSQRHLAHALLSVIVRLPMLQHTSHTYETNEIRVEGDTDTTISPNKPWFLAVSMLSQLVRASRAGKEVDTFAEHVVPVFGAWRRMVQVTLDERAHFTNTMYTDGEKTDDTVVYVHGMSQLPRPYGALEHSAKLLHLILTISDASDAAVDRLGSCRFIELLLDWWELLFACLESIPDACLSERYLRLLYRSSTLPLWALELYTQQPKLPSTLSVKHQSRISKLLLQTVILLGKHDTKRTQQSDDPTSSPIEHECLATTMQMYATHIARFGVVFGNMTHRHDALITLTRHLATLNVVPSASEAETDGDVMNMERSPSEHTTDHEKNDSLERLLGAAYHIVKCENHLDTTAAMNWDECNIILSFAYERLQEMLARPHLRRRGDSWACELVCLGLRYNASWSYATHASRLDLTRFLCLSIPSRAEHRMLSDAMGNLIWQYGDSLIWHPNNMASLISIILVCARRLETGKPCKLGNIGAQLPMYTCWKLLRAALSCMLQRVSDQTWLTRLHKYGSIQNALQDIASEEELALLVEEERQLCAVSTHDTHSQRSFIPLLFWLITRWSPCTAQPSTRTSDNVNTGSTKHNAAAWVRGQALVMLMHCSEVASIRHYYMSRLDWIQDILSVPHIILPKSDTTEHAFHETSEMTTRRRVGYILSTIYKQLVFNDQLIDMLADVDSILCAYRGLTTALQMYLEHGSPYERSIAAQGYTAPKKLISIVDGIEEGREWSRREEITAIQLVCSCNPIEWESLLLKTDRSSGQYLEPNSPMGTLLCYLFSMQPEHQSLRQLAAVGIESLILAAGNLIHFDTAQQDKLMIQILQEHIAQLPELDKHAMDSPRDRITFYVGPQRHPIPASRTVMARGSHYFSAMLEGSFSESQANDIELPAMEPNAVEMIVFFFQMLCDLELNDDAIWSLSAPEASTLDIFSAMGLARMIGLTVFEQYCAHLLLDRLCHQTQDWTPDDLLYLYAEITSDKSYAQSITSVERQLPLDHVCLIHIMSQMQTMQQCETFQALFCGQDDTIRETFNQHVHWLMRSVCKLARDIRDGSKRPSTPCTIWTIE